MGIRKTKTEVRDYLKHHVRSTKTGQEIVIVSGEKDKENVWTINCKWPNRKRDDSGRVEPVKIKNFCA